MSWLTDILSAMRPFDPRAHTQPMTKAEAKEQIVRNLLNLIEQSKEKDLPLHWLAGEINKL